MPSPHTTKMAPSPDSANAPLCGKRDFAEVIRDDVILRILIRGRQKSQEREGDVMTEAKVEGGSRGRKLWSPGHH